MYVSILIHSLDSQGLTGSDGLLRKVVSCSNNQTTIVVCEQSPEEDGGEGRKDW